MPWILLLLAALFTAPLSAAALPGVPTANTDKTSASARQHPDADAAGGERRDHGAGERHADQPGIRRAALVSLLSTVAQYHRLTA